MKPALLVLLVLALAGCAWDYPTESAGKGSAAVDLYADKADLVMSRAAAAVQAARESNLAGKAQAVEAELIVAGTYLPRPRPADLAFAKARAASNDPKAYEEAQEVADDHSRALDDLWAGVEAWRASAAANLEAKELEAVQARKTRGAVAAYGFGFLVSIAGLVLFVWGDKFGASKVEAGAVFLSGAGIASLPWIAESQITPWVLGGLGAVLAVRVAAWAWTSGWRKGKGGGNGTV